MVKAIVIALAIGGTGLAWVQVASDSGDPVAVAAREARNGWSARTVQTGDATVFPYGRVQPTVTCAPLRACVIELESGEVVMGKASGDAERWLIDQTATGQGGKTVLIVVKPTACRLMTNLVVSTNRRVYDLSLASPPCATRSGGTGGSEGGDAAYTRMVRFYYPDPLRAVGTGADTAPELGGDRPRLEALHFGYAIHADRHVRWTPTAMYDDGVHTYLRFPAEMAHGPLPVLRAVDGSGAPALINYSVEGDAFVVDRVIEHARLIMGDDKGQGVDIVNTRLAAPRSGGGA